MDNDTMYLAFAGVLMCYAAVKVLKQRQVRRYKTRPINRGRHSTNYLYYEKMKQLDAPQFFKYTRMTVEAFEIILGIVKPYLKHQIRYDTISPEQRLIITLQYLSQGTSMQVLSWTFNIGITTVHKIIHETCAVIWDQLSPVYLKSPSTEKEWQDISHGFLQRWDMPHCLGAIDGKHVNIQAPPRSGSRYYNYKHNFSIVLLATCDSNYRFTFVDVGAYGSQSDGGVLKNSIFGKRLEEGGLNIPKPSYLPFTNITLPHFLVADEAFPLKEYIMRPYPGKQLLDKQRIFNYWLSRTRQTIENTFGLLVARWRILKTTITANVENVDNIVKAVVVLHNFCQKEVSSTSDLYCPAGFVDSNDRENGDWRKETPLPSVGRTGANIARKVVYQNRDILCDYFLSENGQISWQSEMINRGKLFN
ncbi:hypothetical protein RI129_000502 [Pyrocoelia pectoralis]|uniref:DDE Tnp4 domain-containing protein n=1 Tax=Pyrocoelia pectoralis TaxID=417401 RepID=A0AAN7VSZ9_9COLE